jgi:NMD protein affecting ribosome stability and mRNA decay
MGGLCRDGNVEARGMAGAGDVEANGRRCPKCGAVIDHLDYWERAINTGEYWPDGFHNVRNAAGYYSTI